MNATVLWVFPPTDAGTTVVGVDHDDRPGYQIYNRTIRGRWQHIAVSDSPDTAETWFLKARMVPPTRVSDDFAAWLDAVVVERFPDSDTAANVREVSQ